MLANFVSLIWGKNDVQFITRKSWEKKPTTTCKKYKKNEDGSITYMVTKPNEYLLTLQKEDGTLVSEDIYGVIKYYNREVRITKKFRTAFENFMSVQSYSVEDNGFIKGIYNNVEIFFRDYM